MSTTAPRGTYTALKMCLEEEHSWYTSETYTEGYTIGAGKCGFTFWASCTIKGDAILKIEFGYCVRDGTNKIRIAEATATLTFPRADAVCEFFTTLLGGDHTLPPGGLPVLFSFKLDGAAKRCLSKIVLRRPCLPIQYRYASD